MFNFFKKLPPNAFKCRNKISTFKKKIYVYKPAMLHISKNATVSVKKNLLFNKQWDKTRQRDNKLVGSLFIDDNAQLIVNSFSFLAGCRVNINNGAKLVLNSGYMNHDSVIDCFEHIEIGKNCCISERVVIRDSNNHTIKRDDYIKTAPIHIGDNVWIGLGATILSGVTIGNSSIIAAGAVVNKDVPAHSLVAGIPAKVIRSNVEWTP